MIVCLYNLVEVGIYDLMTYNKIKKLTFCVIHKTKLLIKMTTFNLKEESNKLANELLKSLDDLSKEQKKGEKMIDELDVNDKVKKLRKKSSQMVYDMRRKLVLSSHERKVDDLVRKSKMRQFEMQLQIEGLRFETKLKEIENQRITGFTDVLKNLAL